MAAPVYPAVFDPIGVAGTQGSRATADSATHDCITNAIATVSADSSKLSGAKFCFQSEGGTLVLRSSQLQMPMPNPWAVRPIQFFSELLSTHHNLVLIRISSTDRLSPTELLVYNFPIFGDGATVVRIPHVASEISTSASFGLIRHSSNSKEYVVANMQRQFNPKIERVETFLHRWRYSSSSCRYEQKKVTVPSCIDMGKWQTDQVITFTNHALKFDRLLWVDLCQGVILCCNNPLKNSKANFNFICLPHHQRVPHRRAAIFSCVGCCNGELKFVKVDIGGVDTVNVAVMTFNEGLYKRCSNIWQAEEYWNKTSKPLNCISLWTKMKNMPALQLPSDWKASENHMPCFPVLSRSTCNILYLILARKVGVTAAWLLKFDMSLWDLESAAAYPGFNQHKKPPMSSNWF